jgi:hypothetical protein
LPGRRCSRARRLDEESIDEESIDSISLIGASRSDEVQNS